jgi:hypothetical protein
MFIRDATCSSLVGGETVKKLVLVILLAALPVFAQEQPLPLHLGIVLHASKNTFPQQQAAATELIQKLVHTTGDEAFVVTAGGDKPWPYERLDWDNNVESLTKFIKGLDKNSGLPEAFKFEVQSTSSSDFRSWLTVYKGAPPEQSVFAIAAQIMRSDPRPARKVLIMFRDPWEHAPGWGGAYGQFVDRRHEAVISMIKESGVSIYVVGIDEISTRPKMPQDIGTTYGTTYTGSGGAMRTIDQAAQKEMDIQMNAGRANVERMAMQTGGAVAYGNKKNYADAVPVIIGKVESSSSSSAGK